MDENPLLSSLRGEISNRASTALQLCSIPGNNTISPHWRLFSPICELIKASVEDEKSIPHFLARIDGKVSEMRRRLDPSLLDEVIALNILQMFSGFVKFMKTLSHMDPSGDSPAEMNGEIERLKNELFNRETELETLKRNHEAIRMGGEMLRDQFNCIFGMDYEDDTGKTPSNAHVNRLQVSIPKSKNMIQSSPLTRGKRETQMVRTLTTTEVLPSLPPLPSFPSPFASLLDPSSTPQYHTSTITNDAMLALRNILSNNYNGSIDERPVEIELKKDTKRRRHIESPMYGREEEEDDGSEMKRSCSEFLRNVTHGGEREDHHPCPFENCQRTFNKIGTLFEHTTSDHYSEGMMQVQCSSCREYYDREKSYETHTLNCPTAVPIMTMKRWDHEETNQERIDRLALEKKLQTCPYAGCTYVSKSKSRSIFKHMNKSHGNDGRAWYKCTCGMKRRTLFTMLFHRYSDCRTGEIDWLIDSPALLKTEDWNDGGAMA